MSELISSLRPETAPELSQQLHHLYIYIQQRLLDANFRQVEGPLGEVLSLLTTLEQGWAGAAAVLATAEQPKQQVRGMRGAAEPERQAVHA